MGRGLDGYLFLTLLRPCAVFKLHRASRKIPVAHSERETPLPIPNRAVKPLSADGTWGETSWESRSPPVLLMSSPRPDLARAAAAGFLEQVALGVAADCRACRCSAGCRGGICATLARPPSGLDAVLAEGCEVDQ